MTNPIARAMLQEAFNRFRESDGLVFFPAQEKLIEEIKQFRRVKHEKIFLGRGGSRDVIYRPVADEEDEPCTE